MKTAAALIGVMLCVAMASASADEAKPYTEGQVTELSYVKIKPGKFEEYMKYLDTTYKTIMEAQKKAGLITGYGVYSAQPRSPQEPDLILSIVYPNMAALDRTAESGGGFGENRRKCGRSEQRCYRSRSDARNPGQRNHPGTGVEVRRLDRYR